MILLRVARSPVTAACFIVALLAFAARLLLLAELAKDPVWHFPVLDERTYVTNAAAILSGNHDRLLPYYQAPGSTYIFTALLSQMGPDIWNVRLVQALLSSTSTVLTLLVAHRFMPLRWCVVAGMAVAANGLHALTSVELLPAVWAECLLTLSALLLTRIRREESAPGYVCGSAAAMGITFLFSPFVAAAMPVLLWLGARLKVRPTRLLLASLLFLLPSIPIAILNLRASERRVVISGNVGLNF